MLKYPLLEPLLACEEKVINAAFDYLDFWSQVTWKSLTLEWCYEVFPQFSSGECEVIFNSWKKAHDG
jgi:hypothetical protein